MIPLLGKHYDMISEKCLFLTDFNLSEDAVHISIQQSKQKQAQKKADLQRAINDAGYNVSFDQIEDIVSKNINDRKNILLNIHISAEQKEKTLEEALSEIFKEVNLIGIPKSFLIIVAIFIFEAFLTTLLSIVLGPLAWPILSFLVYPMIEQWGTYMAVKEKYSGTWVIMTNVMRFLNTATMFSWLFGSVGAGVVIGSLRIFSDLIVTAVQKQHMDIDPDKAYWTAVALHAVFNFAFVMPAVLQAASMVA